MKRLIVVILISTLFFLPGENQPTITNKLHHPEVEPDEWMALQRAYPHGKIKQESYLEAMQYAAKLHASNPSNRDYTWEFEGPTNIGGRITDLAIHPDDTDIMYIGAASGGIWKTTDFGQNWEYSFEGVPTISIGDLALDPNNPDIIYAGTGESNSSSYSFYGSGIYKSTDAGASWTYSGLDFSAYIGRIIVDYDNSDRIFVAACGTLFSTNDQRGIYRSPDAGATWERVLFVNDSTAGIDLVQHPTNPDVLYASMWQRSRGLVYRNSFGDGSGLWKTTDGGDNWVEMTNGLPTGDDVGRIGIDIAQSNPDVLWAFYDMPGGEVQIYQTSDGGDSWSRKDNGQLDGMNSSFGWYFGQLRVDPNDENRVFTLGVDMFRTEDGGNSWDQIAGYFNFYEIHVDHHAMFIRDDGRIIEGNDGGLYYTDNYGDDWEKINNMPLTQFYAIDVDYLNPQRIYGGTQDNNTIRTWHGGTDDWTPILGGDGMYCLVDYTNSLVIYAESQYGNLAKSTDGGNSFNAINWAMSGDRVNWSAPLAMDPQNPQILYFGTYRVWKTYNGGSSWTDVSGDITQGGSNYFHTVTTIDVSKADPEYVAAGTADGRMHISTDGGDNWTDVSAGLPNRWMTRVHFDPHDKNTVYATVSGFRWDEPVPHVFMSTDLGQNWTNISGNLPDMPVNVIVADPGYEGVLFVGTDAGMFYTIDYGNEWMSINDGLPLVPVTTMKIHPFFRKLTVGTYGVSAYSLDLDMIVGNDELNAGIDSGLDIYPNPVYRSKHTSSNIEFTIEKSTPVKLAVYSQNGRLIENLADNQLTAGTYNYKWTGPAGSYIIVLQKGSKTVTEKLLIIQ